MVTDDSVDATVIIRSVGERTESACRKLILDQGVGDEALITVNETPFSRALLRGCEIGMDAGKRWTFFVDADLLLRPGSIRRMVEIAEKQPPNVCEVQGYVLDKLFGGARMGGVHVYRTALLSKFIKSIPQEGSDIRPESRALQTMADLGFPWRLIPELVGLHDFEQSYEDIFRKSFVLAHKQIHLVSLFANFWRERSNEDPDYRVALAGFAAGLTHQGEVRIDKTAAYYRQGLNYLELEEKKDLPASKWDLDRVENTIANWQEPEIYWQFFPTGMLSPKPSLVRRSLLFMKLYSPRRGRKVVMTRLSSLLGRLSAFILRNA